MCQWGNDKIIHVIRRNNPHIEDGWHSMAVDACIADDVQAMNEQGILTIGCCCGHGKQPAHVLVATESKGRMDELGYAYEQTETYLVHFFNLKQEIN